VKYTKRRQGRTSTVRRLWQGAEYDAGAYLKAVTYWGCDVLGLELSVGGDDREIGVTLSVLWRTIYAGIYLPAWRLKLPDWPRTTGFSLVWFREDFGVWDMPLSIDLWKDGSGTALGDHQKWPWQGYGWHLYLHPLRWIPGDADYQEDTASIAQCDVIVRMPEGDYPGTFKSKRVKWQRPRWTTAPWCYRCEIEVPGGIAVPGKGENSWDCDDNAHYSATFAATTEPTEPHDAAQRFALDVLKERQKYASLSWRPREGWPAHCRQESA
jgi:hypothetical protein